jgi:Ca2+-binding RTX toxin-like protein
MAKGGASTGKYVINGTSGDDLLDGSIYSTSLQDRGLSINGAGGNDTIKGGSGADILSGGNGNDLVYGDLADLSGAGSGKIVWDGGNGSDTLDLSAIPYADGTGTMIGFYGNGDSQVRLSADKDDTSAMGPGMASSSDVIYRGNFQNFENFTLGNGNDSIYMTTASINNVLDGGGGNDLIWAGGGNDTIYGGDGNDFIEGSWGNDIAYGGAGSDVFTWQGALAGQYTYDTIKDFDVDSSDGSHDEIWLGGSWEIQWDANSTVLHGYLVNGTVTLGEITLEGLSYADAASVIVHHIDAAGFPI